MTEGLSLPVGSDRPGPSEGSSLLVASMAEGHARPPVTPGWREAQRAEALSCLEARGFPSPTDEAFRFTPLRKVLRAPFSRVTAPHIVDETELARVTSGREGAVVLVNGYPSGTLPERAGLRLFALRDVLRDAPDLVEPYLGRIAELSHGFLAQNTALFDDGLVVVVTANEKASLHVVHVARAGGGPTSSTPRVLVIAEGGSALRLVETHVSSGRGAHLENSVTEVSVGPNASVDHVRVHHGTEDGSRTSSIAVRQERDSRYASHVFTFGGSLTRLDLKVTFEAEGAECILDGLYLVGPGDLTDHHTVVDHAKARCSSRERYKGVIDGNGVAVFDGTVLVRRRADGTAAHQENRNLLLSDDAVVHTKPHLEIDTDDVKCSHGATVGRLDPAQLFYLRSRGMDAGAAKALLTYGFAKEMASVVTDDAIRASIEDAVLAFLPSGQAVKEFA
jgi:Fe-S cluster assembly protein SufD